MKSMIKAKYYLVILTIFVISGCSTHNKQSIVILSKNIETKKDLLNAVRTIGEYREACKAETAEYLFSSPVKYENTTSIDGVIVHSWYQNASNAKIISQILIQCQSKDKAQHFAVSVVVETKYTCIEIDDIKRVFGEPNFIERFGPLTSLVKSMKAVNSEDILYSIIYQSDQLTSKFVFNFTNCAVLVFSQKGSMR
ncbi:hypothetical protein [Azospirillum sp. Marseille-Q6669]